MNFIAEENFVRHCRPAALAPSQHIYGLANDLLALIVVENELYVGGGVNPNLKYALLSCKIAPITDNTVESTNSNYLTHFR